MFQSSLLDFELPLALLWAQESALLRIKPGRRARGLTEPKVRVLYVLSRTGEPVLIRPLGRACGMLQAEIREHCRHLAAKGLARWEQPEGAPWPKIVISTQGRGVLAKIASDAANSPRASWGGLASVPVEGLGFSQAMRDEMLASVRSLRRAAEGAAVVEGANEPGDTGDDPVFGLPLLLHLTRNALLTRIRPTLSAHGFSEPQWRALRVLQGSVRRPGSHITAIALLSGGNTMNRIANALHARGLIRRDTLGYRTARDKPRKRFMIEITPLGRAAIAEVEAQFRTDCADLFERLDGARLARLEKLLRRFAAAALWVKDGTRHHPFHDTYAQCRASARVSVKRWQALVKEHGENAPRRRAKPKMEGVFWAWPGMPKRTGLGTLDPLPVGSRRELKKLSKPDP